ncbi:DEAD/DEAH box helicase [Rhizobium ruizarguesonis]|uniref:helicase-related protein n=1 Tax=Rhizobium ruizarguesonis TaxID=2081791 RepID=UPI00163961D7|nr:DEAD/DEAH box helicase [Rhizobium ruizarguesonis]MBC2806619.1 DEAD/DEAH box helicase [Rhizobium ruizarguesonis]
MTNATLRTDQVADLAFYMANPKCLNLSHAGTGKTPSVCVMQWFMWTQHGIGTVWAQPKSLLKKNKRELLRFTDFRDEDVVIVDGTPKQVEKQLNSGAKVFLMGFRRMTLCWRKLPEFVKAVHIDEFHMGYKSADSQNSLALFKMFDTGRMTHFIPMTGTLIDGKLSSAYPAIRVIDPRYYISHENFLNYHGVKDIDGKIVSWRNHEKLSKIFGRHAILRTFASVHGEQEVVHIPEMVDMEDKQRTYYDKFHDDAVLELETFYIDGTLPGVAFARARQLMEHPNLFPDLANPGQFIDVLNGEPTGKEERLKVHFEEHYLNEKPLIIFTPMIPQQMRVAELLKQFKIPFVTINGSISQKKRDDASDAFEQGLVQAVLATPQTAAFGYNWQFCGKREVDHMIFTALDFGDATFVQARQRAIRGKRSSPLRLTTLEYIESIDQHICHLIWRKSVDANKVDPSRPVLQLSGFEAKSEKLAA